MTAVPSPSVARFAELAGDELRGRLREALTLYVTAMQYPKGTAEQRAPMWLAHMLRVGWRCVAAFDTEDRMAGIAYGYQGAPGQWWHEQVKRGVAERHGVAVADRWMTDYFELTELHVRPDTQGQGIGGELVRRLVAGAGNAHVLLSTPEGPSRAWNLYRKLEFVDVLRDYQFAGDPRPFGVLGRTLPLT
ncbi:GNAT family N-acetyltransferase [Actinokineospora globicatena]|uniref:GNAT family N-acetyltransferase n=1 Tax=Actinokineospora globicatena TaxID=103729 RepID=UPI0020A3792A|nr:GNAT family N-acetyltransferase [Actinokineospora globicatena]MCP2302553.1 Acetyltransferase (GNAT) family protein [Actinokineospora globicatena]GLW75760.1 acetyltransferase [Actinokineospora globicatena]GLW82600.1 acetyltransferase [Actinokineospora globicatena]